MIVLDTTILVYAVGDGHLLREPCLSLLECVQAGRLEATTTVEVIQEFAHVRSRRRTRADAAELARRFAALLGPLVQSSASDLVDGLGIFERHADLGAFDSVLAAACMSRSTVLVSADRSFLAVPGLHHVVPGTPEFEDLLA